VNLGLEFGSLLRLGLHVEVDSFLRSILFAPIRSHQRSGFRFQALMLFTDFDYIIFGKVTNLFFLVCELESLWPV
jgi:hypothetical protein